MNNMYDNTYLNTINLNYLIFNKTLINVYTIKLIRHKNDKPHGIVSNNVGIIISILSSLFVQLDIVKLVDVILS